MNAAAKGLIPAFNLRDYGGYAVAGGGRLRQGQLYRSGQFDGAPGEYDGLMARLGIDTVIDLRSAREIPEARPGAFAGLGAALNPVFEDGSIPHALEGLAHLTGADEAAARMTDVYRRLPFSGRFVEAMRLYMRGLLGCRQATLIHCFAGKDRTGLAVAFAQAVLGVHGDDRIAEYLLTNAMGEVRLARASSAFRASLSFPVNDAVLGEIMTVRPEYLLAAEAAITERVGGIGAYADQILGWSGEDIARLAERYIA